MKKREIKKYGNTFVIKLEVADIKDYNLKVGDLLDLEEVFKIGVIKNAKKKN